MFGLLFRGLYIHLEALCIAIFQGYIYRNPAIVYPCVYSFDNALVLIRLDDVDVDGTLRIASLEEIRNACISGIVGSLGINHLKAVGKGAKVTFEEVAKGRKRTLDALE